MKASELIAKLKEMKEAYGDYEVKLTRYDEAADENVHDPVLFVQARDEPGMPKFIEII